MSNYYFFTWDDKPKEATSAFAPDGIGADHELIPALEGKNALPFTLELRRVKETKTGIEISNDLSGLSPIWLDYQPSSLLWPMMSENLKSVVERNLTGEEGIDWITANITDGNEVRNYFVMRFNKFPDVLNVEKTMFVSGTDHVIRPVFSAEKIKGLNIFTKPSSDILWRLTSSVYVSDALKKQIKKEKLTGMAFEKALVS